MSSERWQEIERLFHEALAHPAADRVAFLKQACAGDEELLHEVESLARSSDQARSFIEHPPLEAEARAMGSASGPALSTGDKLGPYEIVSPIGAGGMGEVYRARDTKLNRNVALKVLPQALAGDTQLMARFQREAQVLASLNHPNIAAIYGLEESGASHALVMELVEGQTLAERLVGPASSVAAVPNLRDDRRPSTDEKSGAHRAPLQLDETLQITQQIAEALEYAHERGIIHRDLKPANIKITPASADRPEGTVKVLDFGLAKALEPTLAAGLSPAGSDAALKGGATNSPTFAPAMTESGLILGTAAYMAPEQAKAKPVDRRADIWAFGCVLFEMLAGQKAFGGETVSERLAAVIMKEPDWTALPATTPAEIQRLLRRCLTKDPRQRLRDIGEARIAIEETLNGTDFSEAADDGRPQSREEPGAHGVPLQPSVSDSQVVAALLRRHQGKLALAAALLAAFVIAGAYAIYRLSRPAAKQQTVASAVSAGMQITQLTSSGTALLAAISPDGRYVAYAQQDAGGQSLWLRQIATGSAVEIVPPAGVQYVGLTFSPDGNYLDYVQAPQNRGQLTALYRAPVLGGQTHKLLENVDSAVTFSPGGKRIAFVRGLSGQASQLLVANSDGSGERVLASKRLPQSFLPAFWYGKPAWSPDGRTIAVSAGTFSPWEMNPTAFDVRTGREQKIGARHWDRVDQMTWQPDGKGLLLEANSAGRQQIWRLSYPSGKFSRVTNDLNHYLGVSITADGGTLATVQTHSASNVWTAAKGEWDHPRQVTHGLSNVDGLGGLSWTAGGKIAYNSATNGTSSLWLADPASGRVGELVQKGVDDFKPSACGKAGLIVFVATARSASGAANKAIWRANADGSGLEQLTHAGSDTEESCSPDGRWVVYVSTSSGNATLWKVPIDSGKPVQITEKGASWLPSVSPDGKWILYYHSAGPRSPWQATIRPFAGGKAVRTFPTPFIHGGGGMPISVAWMPDSRAFAYVVQKGGISNIVRQPIDGGPVRHLTRYTSGRIFALDISRDGKLALARGTQSSDVVLIKGFQ